MEIVRQTVVLHFHNLPFFKLLDQAFQYVDTLYKVYSDKPVKSIFALCLFSKLTLYVIILHLRKCYFCNVYSSQVNNCCLELSVLQR